jgi:6-phospho-3-hexuloisomerase
MNAREKALLVVSELREALTRIPLGLTEDVCDVLLNADEIFVAGAGRSGLMAKAFCMRLMHLGLRSFMVGEVVTPNLRNSGVLVICSGSGETKSLVSMAEKAVSIGAPIVLVTINPESTIGTAGECHCQNRSSIAQSGKRGRYCLDSTYGKSV